MTNLFVRLRQRLRPGRTAPLILMYHRVADLRVDPWGLAVHPDRFGAHLEVLRVSRRAFAMSEFVSRAKRGTLPRNAVAITFDDGYADTLRRARPRLAAAGMPATLFLATAFVGQPFEYWWDELARGILERAQPLDERVTVAGQTYRLRLALLADPTGSSAAWRGWEPPRTERQELYYTLWERLRGLPAADRDITMTRLREVLRAPAPDPDGLPMSATEIGELAAGGLFEIGGHTATHPVLPTLSPAERRREILEGKFACERLTDGAVSGFAYPHGANDPDSRAAVAECGFDWACTTESRALARFEPDWYALPRVPVLNWDAPAFERALRTASA